MDKTSLPIIIEIPAKEVLELDKLIKTYRKSHIRNSIELVNKTIIDQPTFINQIKEGKVSEAISKLRELAWNEYLKDEVKFNILLMQELSKKLKTPKLILDKLLDQDLSSFTAKKVKEKVVEICGEYSGRIYPYIYI